MIGRTTRNPPKKVVFRNEFNLFMIKPSYLNWPLLILSDKEFLFILHNKINQQKYNTGICLYEEINSVFYTPFVANSKTV